MKLFDARTGDRIRWSAHGYLAHATTAGPGSLKARSCAPPAERLHIAEVPEPAPPARSRSLISACGICGTDLHIMRGTSYRPELPFVLGHEPVGTVVQRLPRRRPGARRAPGGRRDLRRLRPLRGVSGGRRAAVRARRPGHRGARPLGWLRRRLSWRRITSSRFPQGWPTWPPPAWLTRAPPRTTRPGRPGGRPRSGSFVVAGAGPVGPCSPSCWQPRAWTRCWSSQTRCAGTGAAYRGLRAVGSLEEAPGPRPMCSSTVPGSRAPSLGCWPALPRRALPQRRLCRRSGAGSGDRGPA